MFQNLLLAMIITELHRDICIKINIGLQVHFTLTQPHTTLDNQLAKEYNGILRCQL